MRKWTVLLLVTAVSACTVGPDYRPPEMATAAQFQHAEAAQAQASSETAEASLAHFWTRFDDASLNQLIEQSLQTNHDLRIALANWEAARALHRSSRADYFPVTTVNAGRERRRISEYESRTGEVSHTDLDYGSLDAVWQLDLFGRVRRNVEAQQASTMAAKEDWHAVRVSVVAEVANNYMALRGAQEQLAVVKRHASNQQQALQLAETMEEVGRGTQFDTVRVRALLDSTRAALGPLQSDIHVYIHRLAVLTGQAPDTLYDTLLVQRPWPQLPRLTQVGDPEAMLRRRPDIRAAERRLATATAAIGIAEADWFPQVTLLGEVEFSADSFGRAGDNAAANYRYGPSIRWSALDFVHVQARVSQSEAQQRAALASYEQVVLGALEETENSLSRYSGNRQRLQQLEASMVHYRKALELARLRYQGGSINFLEVLDAERQMLAAEENYVQTRTAVATSLIGIYKALGGGWQV